MTFTKLYKNFKLFFFNFTHSFSFFYFPIFWTRVKAKCIWVARFLLFLGFSFIISFFICGFQHSFFFNEIYTKSSIFFYVFGAVVSVLLAYFIIYFAKIFYKNYLFHLSFISFGLSFCLFISYKVFWYIDWYAYLAGVCLYFFFVFLVFQFNGVSLSSRFFLSFFFVIFIVGFVAFGFIDPARFSFLSILVKDLYSLVSGLDGSGASTIGATSRGLLSNQFYGGESGTGFKICYRNFTGADMYFYVYSLVYYPFFFVLSFVVFLFFVFVRYQVVQSSRISKYFNFSILGLFFVIVLFIFFFLVCPDFLNFYNVCFTVLGWLKFYYLAFYREIWIGFAFLSSHAVNFKIFMYILIFFFFFKSFVYVFISLGGGARDVSDYFRRKMYLSVRKSVLLSFYLARRSPAFARRWLAEDNRIWDEEEVYDSLMATPEDAPYFYTGELHPDKVLFNHHTGTVTQITEGEQFLEDYRLYYKVFDRVDFFDPRFYRYRYKENLWFSFMVSGSTSYTLEFDEFTTRPGLNYYVSYYDVRTFYNILWDESWRYKYVSIKEKDSDSAWAVFLREVWYKFLYFPTFGVGFDTGFYRTTAEAYLFPRWLKAVNINLKNGLPQGREFSHRVNFSVLSSVFGASEDSYDIFDARTVGESSAYFGDPLDNFGHGRQATKFGFRHRYPIYAQFLNKWYSATDSFNFQDFLNLPGSSVHTFLDFSSFFRIWFAHLFFDSSRYSPYSRFLSRVSFLVHQFNKWFEFNNPSSFGFGDLPPHLSGYFNYPAKRFLADGTTGFEADFFSWRIRGLFFRFFVCTFLSYRPGIFLYDRSFEVSYFNFKILSFVDSTSGSFSFEFRNLLFRYFVDFGLFGALGSPMVSTEVSSLLFNFLFSKGLSTTYFGSFFFNYPNFSFISPCLPSFESEVSTDDFSQPDFYAIGFPFKFKSKPIPAKSLYAPFKKKPVAEFLDSIEYGSEFTDLVRFAYLVRVACCINSNCVFDVISHVRNRSNIFLFRSMMSGSSVFNCTFNSANSLRREFLGNGFGLKVGKEEDGLLNDDFFSKALFPFSSYSFCELVSDRGFVRSSNGFFSGYDFFSLNSSISFLFSTTNIYYFSGLLESVTPLSIIKSRYVNSYFSSSSFGFQRFYDSNFKLGFFYPGLNKGFKNSIFNFSSFYSLVDSFKNIYVTSLRSTEISKFLFPSFEEYSIRAGISESFKGFRRFLFLVHRHITNVALMFLGCWFHRTNVFYDTMFTKYFYFRVFNYSGVKSRISNVPKARWIRRSNKHEWIRRWMYFPTRRTRQVYYSRIDFDVFYDISFVDRVSSYFFADIVLNKSFSNTKSLFSYPFWFITMFSNVRVLKLLFQRFCL